MIYKSATKVNGSKNSEIKIIRSEVLIITIIKKRSETKWIPVFLCFI